jgi:Fe-Mn family superoxide dismutase
MEHTRRNFIKSGMLLSAGTLAGTHLASGAVKELVSLFPTHTAFTLPDLGYPYDALEPHIDTVTMQIHHDKHHNTYVTKLNEAVEKEASIQNRSLEDLVRNIGKLPESVRTAVRNNGGGHWNHSFFWSLLQKGSSPSTMMQEAIKANFVSMEAFQKSFEKAASGVFGSGWAWVIKGPEGKLSITTTSNQDNPLMDISSQQGTPILGVDVWEHAYYLKYQNKRADYLQAYWKVLNWSRVEEIYTQK